ncbi:MAG: SRPBCC domain-containing protein [Caldimonas sp.]
MNSVATATATEPETGSALVLRRVFDATPELVFRLWSDPARVKEWWHPKGFTTPVFDMDFRVGGAYRYCIRSNEHQGWAHGIYQEIDAPHRLAMTFQWETGDPAHDIATLITLTFEAQGEAKTLLTFRQAPFSSESERKSHGEGWRQVLDAFALSLEGEPS